MAVLQDAGIRLTDADVLASLSLKRYTETEKRQAVETMQEQLTAYADSVAGKILAASAAMEENAKKVDEAASIIRDCDRKQGGFSQIRVRTSPSGTRLTRNTRNAASMRKRSSLTNTYRA